MIRTKFLQVLQAGEEGKRLSSEDLHLLLSAGRGELEMLLGAADGVRRKYMGDEIHLRGIVEFSNVCVQNCWYCGLRRDNRQLTRYRMTPQEIMKTAEKAKSRGLKTLVLQSGEDPWFTRERISRLILGMKEFTGLAITLSVGERSDADFEEWKQTGADRYLLKQETSSAVLFHRLRPGRRLKDRLHSLRTLKELGYEVGSGNMVGLPGQTDRDLVRDIQLFVQYDFDMVGIGPFIPHPQTPLAGSVPGDLTRTLKVLAVTRLLTRNTNLPATTAAGVSDPEGRRKALLAGANVIMPNITPWAYRKHYEIYPGKAHEWEEEDRLEEIIFSLGRKVGHGAGSRPYPKKSIK